MFVPIAARQATCLLCTGEAIDAYDKDTFGNLDSNDGELVAMDGEAHCVGSSCGYPRKPSERSDQGEANPGSSSVEASLPRATDNADDRTLNMAQLQRAFEVTLSHCDPQTDLQPRAWNLAPLPDFDSHPHHVLGSFSRPGDPFHCRNLTASPRGCFAAGIFGFLNRFLLSSQAVGVVEETFEGEAVDRGSYLSDLFVQLDGVPPNFDPQRDTRRGIILCHPTMPTLLPLIHFASVSTCAEQHQCCNSFAFALFFVPFASSGAQATVASASSPLLLSSPSLYCLHS